jgi:hypothetical protein
MLYRSQNHLKAIEWYDAKLQQTLEIEDNFENTEFRML